MCSSPLDAAGLVRRAQTMQLQSSAMQHQPASHWSPTVHWSTHKPEVKPEVSAKSRKAHHTTTQKLSLTKHLPPQRRVASSPLSKEEHLVLAIEKAQPAPAPPPREPHARSTLSAPKVGF